MAARRCLGIIIMYSTRRLALGKQPKYAHHFAGHLDMDSVPLEACSRTLASELRLSDSLYPFHLISTVRSARDALVALPSIIMRPPRRKGYCN